MKIIVGLGNPGKSYFYTRHNAGFLALDFLLKQSASQSKTVFRSEVFQTHFYNLPVVCMKPQTFMNASGQAVANMVRFYKADPAADLFVIHDDKDLPFGHVKISSNSRSGGHNGVQSIIEQLGTQNFVRIRIGIESREPDSPLSTQSFVLQNFSPDELKFLENHTFPDIEAHLGHLLNPALLRS